MSTSSGCQVYLLKELVGFNEVLEQLIVAAHDQNLWGLAHCSHNSAPGRIHSSELAPLVWHLLKDVLAAKDGLQVKPALHAPLGITSLTGDQGGFHH